MSSPLEGQVYDFTGLLDAVERLKCFEQDGSLLWPVACFAQGMAKGPLEENRAGRAHFFAVITDYRHADGRNACSFNLSLDQPHGLVADPSGRGHQDNVDLVCLE